MNQSGSNKAVRALPLPGMMVHSASQGLLTRLASPSALGGGEDNYNLQSQLPKQQAGKSFSTLGARRHDPKSFTTGPATATAGALQRLQPAPQLRKREEQRLNNLMERKHDIVMIGDGSERLVEMMKTIKEQIGLAANADDPGGGFLGLDLADMNKFVGYRTPKLRV